MEGSSSPSHSSHLCDPPSQAEKTEALPKQSEEQREPETPTVSLIGSNWPSLPIPDETDSPIQPGQKEKPPSPVPWKIQTKNPEDHEKDRMGKYAQYFKGKEILPISEIIEKLEPRILSLVVSDLKTRRLVEKGGIRRNPTESRRPMPVFLQTELCNLGRPASHQGTGSKSSHNYNHDQVLPTAAGVHGDPQDSRYSVQRPGYYHSGGAGRVPQ